MGTCAVSPAPGSARHEGPPHIRKEYMYHTDEEFEPSWQYCIKCDPALCVTKKWNIIDEECQEWWKLHKEYATDKGSSASWRN